MHSHLFNLSNSYSTIFLIDKTNTGLKDLNCGILNFMQLPCHFAQKRTVLRTKYKELPCHFVQKRTFSKTKYMELPCHFAQERTFFKTKTWNFPVILHRKELFSKVSMELVCHFAQKDHLYFDMIHQPELSGETFLNIKFTEH